MVSYKNLQKYIWSLLLLLKQFTGLFIIIINGFWNKFCKYLLSREIYNEIELKKYKYSLLTYNINYGYYCGNYNLDTIINKFRTKNIDIVCLQEVPDKKTCEYIFRKKIKFNH